MADYGHQQQTEGLYEGKAVNAEGFYSLSLLASERMGEFVSRLISLTDTLCGGSAENKAAQQGSLRSVANGHFDGAAENCRTVLSELEHANALLSRIENKL